MALQVIILAAGQGKRMYSNKAKVMQMLAGKPLLWHVLKTVKELSSERLPIVVIGHLGDEIKKYFNASNVVFIKQDNQLGTAHAVLAAMPKVNDEDDVLILYGDVPMIRKETLTKFINESPLDAVSVLTTQLSSPLGYGRIVRDHHHNVIRIVEEKDATVDEKNINEVNTGIFYLKAALLKRYLPQIHNENAQKEYYLTDLLPLALLDHKSIYAHVINNHDEIRGVNDRGQLALLERCYQRLSANKLLSEGVTLLDPERFDLRGSLTIKKDLVIDVNVIIEGNNQIGEGCMIGPNCYLRDVTLGDGVIVKANSVIEEAFIGDHCVIGPFARIRPETELKPEVHIGNFVEIKKSVIENKTKINHLTYVGDSEIGKNVNIGAGTITCNYDGANKHKTIIKDNVFVGSATQLVAPVVIGKGATIGAGSTITKDVPHDQLAIARAKQCLIEKWQRPQKKKQD